ncbi:hypothetical protein [Parasphingorhabdus pacifica]
MTQDELQHLDAELAAGRISADEYRSRRDAVLGRSQTEQTGTPAGGVQQQGPPSGGFPQQDAQGPPSGGFPQQDAQGPPSGGFPQQDAQNQQASPFPPAFSWGNASGQGGQQPEAPAEESTQVVQNPLLGSQQPAPPAPGGDADSTQVVNVNQLQQPPQQQAPQQPAPQQPAEQQAPQQWPAQQPVWGPQQGWGTSESSGTPWGDSELPPTPEHGDTSWMRQGPEVFETAGKSSKGKLIAGISFAAVLLVGVAVAAVFYFTAPGGDDSNAGPTAQPKPAPTSQLPEPPAAGPAPTGTEQVLIPAPPGPPHPFNGLITAPDMEGAKGGVLQEPARKVALSNGMIDGFVNRTEGDTTTMLLTVRMPDEAAASEVADAYLDAQAGLSVSDELSYQGVEVREAGNGQFRTAYVAHDWAIIIEVSGGDSAGFTDVLDQQLAQTPPTVLD